MSMTALCDSRRESKSLVRGCFGARRSINQRHNSLKQYERRQHQAGITAANARSVPMANVSAKISCAYFRAFQLNMVPSNVGVVIVTLVLCRTAAVTTVTCFVIGMIIRAIKRLPAVRPTARSKRTLTLRLYGGAGVRLSQFANSFW